MGGWGSSSVGTKLRDKKNSGTKRRASERRGRKGARAEERERKGQSLIADGGHFEVFFTAINNPERTSSREPLTRAPRGKDRGVLAIADSFVPVPKEHLFVPLRISALLSSFLLRAFIFLRFSFHFRDPPLRTSRPSVYHFSCGVLEAISTWKCPAWGHVGHEGTYTTYFEARRNNVSPLVGSGDRSITGVLRFQALTSGIYWAPVPRESRWVREVSEVGHGVLWVKSTDKGDKVFRVFQNSWCELESNLMDVTDVNMKIHGAPVECYLNFLLVAQGNLTV